jgi:twitching motility protein PilI
MSKSRRNKNKHSADARKGGGKASVDKQSAAPGVDTGVDESGQSISDDAAHAHVFSADDASEADTLMAEFAASDDVEAAHDEPITVAADVMETAVDDTPVVDTDAVAADTSATVEASPAETETETETSSEPAAREERHGKRRGKHAKAVPSVKMVVPVEPRTPAFEQLGEYERLSMAHVAGTPQQSDAPGHWRGVGFRLGTRRLAASFDEVVEILSLPQITHVPGAQQWMLGVANVRGTLLPVVDLKQFLEGERTVIHEAQRILVVRQTGGNVAVLIDELFGQRSFNDAQMIKADDDEGRYGYFVKQVYRVGDFDWGVFSMSMLTRTPEFRQAAV